MEICLGNRTGFNSLHLSQLGYIFKKRLDQTLPTILYFIEKNGSKFSFLSLLKDSLIICELSSILSGTKV